MPLINRGVVWLSVQRVTSSLFVRFPWLVISAVCLVFVFNQVKFEGFTGSVQFDDSGKRTQISLEILNLRNSSFQKVRNTVDRIKDYCSVASTLEASVCVSTDMVTSDFKVFTDSFWINKDTKQTSNK